LVAAPPWTDTELLDGLVETGRCGVVERLVAASTHVIGHADLEARGAGAADVAAAASAVPLPLFELLPHAANATAATDMAAANFIT
jgi:hypothetical protein